MNTIPCFKKIYLERTMCYGDCPIYKLFITSKGNVHLTQEHYWGGILKMRKWKLGQEELKKLNGIIYKYGYFGIKKGPFSEGATDMPFCITKIELKDGRKREIEHYLGDNVYPKRLTTIENGIDKIVGIKDYYEETVF